MKCTLEAILEQSNARKRSIFISVLSFEHKMQFNQNHFVLVAWLC